MDWDYSESKQTIIQSENPNEKLKKKWNQLIFSLILG